MNNLISSLFLITVLCVIHLPSNGQSKVEVRREHGRWILIRNNQPYYIKGSVGLKYPEKLKAYGGNSVRSGASQKSLDIAEGLGLTVLADLPVRSERRGFDYNDPVAVEKQKEDILARVRELKDHPALLMWVIGNELDYIPGNKAFNPAVWKAVDEIAAAISQEDPNHPVLTVIGISRMEKVADIERMCPNLDLLGINSYGDIGEVQEILRKYGWSRPYIYTEWGPTGYWQVPKTSWGAPYEETSTEKARVYNHRYRNIILADSINCLGSYVFYWYNEKQETTHTWFGMFDKEGRESEAVGVMRTCWTGTAPENTAPVLKYIKLNGKKFHADVTSTPGSLMKAEVSAKDPDKEALSFKWEVREEAIYADYAGQGEKTPPVIHVEVNKEKPGRISFLAPEKPGAYRVFVYIYDGNVHFATANYPFYIK